MAKRKRLTLPGEMEEGAHPEPYAAGPLTRAPETKAMHPFGVAPAPISRETADAAAMAALRELAEEVSNARAEGRLVQALPLDQVDEGWLVRDRVTVDAEALSGLTESLRTHGQRMAIEVVDHGGSGGAGAMPRYGLISGWRRLSALRALHVETGEARFATVLAVLRRPETAGDAYVAMVEENEIRAGLSYYERARIAAKAVEAGVFPTPKLALQRLYANASRARRSKIGSFLSLYSALGDVLRFPEAIPERLGLALAMRVEAEPDFAANLTAGLARTVPADATAELAALNLALKPGEKGQGNTPADSVKNSHETPDSVTLTFRNGEIRLSGPGVDAGLRDRLEAWLKGQRL
jgi:hypothetical protein